MIVAGLSTGLASGGRSTDTLGPVPSRHGVMVTRSPRVSGSPPSLVDRVWVLLKKNVVLAVSFKGRSNVTPPATAPT